MNLSKWWPRTSRDLELEFMWKFFSSNLWTKWVRRTTAWDLGITAQVVGEFVNRCLDIVFFVYIIAKKVSIAVRAAWDMWDSDTWRCTSRWSRPGRPAPPCTGGCSAQGPAAASTSGPAGPGLSAGGASSLGPPHWSPSWTSGCHQTDTRRDTDGEKVEDINVLLHWLQMFRLLVTLVALTKNRECHTFRMHDLHSMDISW